jgi:hypothetical protein
MDTSWAQAHPASVRRLTTSPLTIMIWTAELIRPIREGLQLLKAAARMSDGDHVLLQVSWEDWNTIEETLRLDARSISFDPEVRQAIARALDGVHYLTDDLLQGDSDVP